MSSERSLRSEVLQLLQDYNNYLPSENSGWPITREMELRMDTSTLTGETYGCLNAALRRLSDEHPRLFEAIALAYLDDTAGHRDVDHWRRNAANQRDARKLPWRIDWRDLVHRHDEGVKKLCGYLQGVDLWVRFGSKAPGPKPGASVEERNAELYATYLRYLDDGLKHSQALKAAALKCDYSVQHARVIIKQRKEDC